MSRCFGSEGVCNYHVRLGAIKIQIQVQYLPNMESVCPLEMVIAIYVYTRIPTPRSACKLVFDGTQITRSFGSSCVPVLWHLGIVVREFHKFSY